MNEPAITTQKRRRRGVLVRTNTGAETRTADVQPEDFDELAAHDVDVHLEMMHEGCAVGTMGDYRLQIYAERGRWPWSTPVLCVRAHYEPETRT